MSSTQNNKESSIASSFGWKMLERLLTQGCSIIVQIILARLLLPSDFGSLAIILAIVNYLSVFVQAGLSAAIIQKKEISSLDINTLFTISFGIAGILYILLFILAPFIADFYNNFELINPIRVSALLLFFFSVNSIQIGVLSRNMDFKTIAIRSSVVIPFSGGIGILLAYCGLGLWSLVVYTLLNSLLICIALYFGSGITLKFQFSRKSAMDLYSFSIKIIGANMVSGFGDLFRTMAIGKKYTTSDLAYYDRAYYYANSIQQVVNNSIQSVLLPVFSRKQDDISILKDLSRKSIRISMFVMIPFLLGMVVVAKPLVLLLLTEKWLPCVPFLMLFLVFRLAGSVVGIDKQVYLALGKSSILFYFEVFLLIANIGMLLITIPISVKAIAIGAFIVEYLSSLVLVVISRKVYDYRIRERVADLYRPVLNSVLMMGVMWLVTLTHLDGAVLIILQILVGLFSYLIFSSLTKDSCLDYFVNAVKNKFNN